MDRGQRRRKKEDETWLTADLRAIKSYGREREKICRYILKRDPFRGNYGLIRAFVNQPKEELGLEESTIFVFRFRYT